MSNSYTVTSAVYDGSFPTQQPGATETLNDPLVWIQGTVNGVRVFAWLFWSLIQAASFVGTSAVQNLLAAAFLPSYNLMTQQYGLVTPPVPNYPNVANIPAPVTGLKGPYGSTFISCSQALVGSWSQ
jgi:hypothetical protein